MTDRRATGPTGTTAGSERGLTPLEAPRLEAYLSRLGLHTADVQQADRSTLDRLCLAHLRAIAFENLDQVFADGVPHDLDAAVDKIVGAVADDSAHRRSAGRGGWCFELNGAFARLLVSLGYDVKLIGCAVLLDGPSRTLDHLALEVTGVGDAATPLLVDVGFGDSFVFPLELNRSGPQPGGNGNYELIRSPEGTTLARIVDDVPHALLRFKRVALGFDDLAPAATRLQQDRSLHWSTTPVVSRLVSPTERVTLRADRLTVTDGDHTEAHTIDDRTAWDRELADRFGMERPGPWPTDT